MTTATPTSGGETRASAGFIGSLAHTPLAEVFRRLVEEQRSGDLQVTGPSAIKTIYFDRGFIVFASSSLKADRFGESMIEAGRISRHQFALASMLMRSNKSKFGQALVDAGIISDEELGCNVALQVNRIVLSLFSFKKGMYSFDERPSNIPVEMMVSLSSYRILIEGVRRMSSKGLVTIGLPALDTEVKIVNQAPFSLDIEQLRPVEKQVLKSVGDGASLRKIVEAVGGQEGVALRACYGLFCGGILEVAGTEGDVLDRLYRVQAETGTFVLSEIRQKIAPREVPRTEPAAPPQQPRASEEVPLTSAEPFDAPPIGYEEPSTTSLMGWLNPGWKAVSSFLHGLIEGSDESGEPQLLKKATSSPKPAPIESLDQEAMPLIQLEPDETPEPTETRTTEDIGVPSWSMKDDPADSEVRTEDLDSALDDATTVRSESLGVPSWSISDLSDSPARRSVARSNVRSHPVDDERSQANRAAPQESEAPPALSEIELADDTDLLVDDDDSSMFRQIPVEAVVIDDASLEMEIELEEEALVDFDESEEAELASSGEAPEPAASLATDVESSRLESSTQPEPASVASARKMECPIQKGEESRILRDVKLHFRTKDWEGAVWLIERLVKIAPSKGTYRGMLARAMSRHPVMRKDAEAHFVAALRLAPQDPELHYWLGLYYQSFGLKSRAVTEFRATLHIAPRHEGARKQLSGEKKADSLSALVKRIFE